MNTNIVELDDSDEYLIYQRNSTILQTEKESKYENSSQKFIKQAHLQSSRQTTVNFSQTIPNFSQTNDDAIIIPSKFTPRPVLLKYIDTIQQLYLQQKRPTQIKSLLKQPTLIQINFILKEKINNFLHIIFQSSHCYTEKQVQKIKPEINSKIQRISIEMLDPVLNNFIDPIRYKNFLKLMKYHKEGRRSQKISKKCYTFFRMFFLKMKFDSIAQTKGNMTQLNLRNNQNYQSLIDQNESEDKMLDVLKDVNIQINPTICSTKDNIKKKYSKQKELIISQKIMDEARNKLIKEIKNKIIPNKYQIEDKLTKETLKTDISNTFEQQQDQLMKKLEVSPVADQFKLIQKDRPIEWTFDKENTLLHLLFYSFYKKHQIMKSVGQIRQKLAFKYNNISNQSLTLEKISQKIQSMYSISCQKFIRRIKFLSIKQGLDKDIGSQKTRDIERLTKTTDSAQKKSLHSITQIQRYIESENDKENLTKKDEHYFSTLKEKLKSFDVKCVYFSSYERTHCSQEWKFMLQFIKQCYFTILEDLNSQYLMKFVQKLKLLNPLNKKITNKATISIEVQNEGEGESMHSKQKINSNTQKNNVQKELMDRLPKSSLCLTLKKISTSKHQVTEKKYNSSFNEQILPQNDETNEEEVSIITLDQIIRKSIEQNRFVSKPITDTIKKNQKQRLLKNQIQGICIQIDAPKSSQNLQRTQAKCSQKVIASGQRNLNQIEERLVQNFNQKIQINNQYQQHLPKDIEKEDNILKNKFIDVDSLLQKDEGNKYLLNFNTQNQTRKLKLLNSCQRQNKQILYQNSNKIGHPIKKIKSNEIIGDKITTFKPNKHQQQIQQIQHFNNERPDQSSDQFEQVQQLSEPMIMEIIEEKQTLKRQILPSSIKQKFSFVPKEKNQMIPIPLNRQITRISQQQIQEQRQLGELDRFSYGRAQWEEQLPRKSSQNKYLKQSEMNHQYKYFSTQGNQLQETYQEGQMKNQSIGFILDQIQDETIVSNRSQHTQNNIQKDFIELSIIKEQEEDVQYNPSQIDERSNNNLLHFEDQYSVYEIDSSNQGQINHQRTHTNINNIYRNVGSKNYQSKYVQNHTKQQLINQIALRDSIQTIDIIKKELQKIKSMEESKSIAQNKTLQIQNNKLIKHEEKLNVHKKKQVKKRTYTRELASLLK